MIKSTFIIVLLLVASSLGIVFSASAEISRPVPGSLTINITADHRDLVAVTKKFGASIARDEREDINRDGVVDILDLTLVAQFFAP